MRNTILKIPILLLFLLLSAGASFAVPRLDLKQVCYRLEENTIECDGTTITEGIIRFEFKFQNAPGISLPVQVELSPFTLPATNLYMLTQVSYQYVSTSSANYYYTLVIHEYDVSNGCQVNPEYQALLERLIGCPDPTDLYLRWNDSYGWEDYKNGINWIDITCCGEFDPESTMEYIESGCVVKDRETGHPRIAVLMDNSLNTTPLYLYYNNNGSWNAIGIPASSSVAVGSTHTKFFYDLGNVPIGCYEFYLSIHDLNFGSSYYPPTRTFIACDCCNADFDFAISTADPFKVWFAPNDPSTMGQTTLDYGDGSSTHNFDPHTYSAEGSYVVCNHVSTDEHGTCEACTYFCVRRVEQNEPSNKPEGMTPVEGEPQPCGFNFTVTGNSSKPGEYNFHAGSLVPMGTSLLWDFGDGTTSTSPSIDHAFATAGEYKVCLTITTDGRSCTKCMTICTKGSSRCGELELSKELIAMTTDGGCMYTVTANATPMPGYFVTGYSWSSTVVPPNPISTTAGNNTWTFSIPPHATTIIMVTVYMMDEYGRKCERTEYISVSCNTHGGGLHKMAPADETDMQGGYAVYPNPTNSDLSVRSSAKDITHITVMDATGKKLGEYKFDSVEKATIPMQSLSAGTYFIIINNSQTRIVNKLD